MRLLFPKKLLYLDFLKVTTRVPPLTGMTPIVGISSLVIMTVSASFYHKKCFQTFPSTGHNSSPILAKLGKMTGYGSGMMPNVGLSGPVITVVPVH